TEKYLTYRELADRLIKYVVDMGYTHIEFMPLSEHPFDGSWGYQVTGYYSVTSRYGRPEDFMYLVDECHRNGIGVIVDWVPAHFPKDAFGLARFDGTALYEHQDKRQGEQPDWGTHIFNFGRNEVRNFLVSNAVFWFEAYHIDGLRVDAVASMLFLDYGKKPGEWIPNKWGGRENVDAINFIRQLNTTVYEYFPGVMMIAEESTSWPLVSKPPYTGGLGFSFKWNMGWMNDYLKYMSMDSVFRKYHHSKITFSIMYAMSENFILVLSHDEVVHGKCSMLSKMPGDYWQKFAGLRASYGYQYGHPGKKLLFMGSEFGQFIEWNYSQSLDWHLLGYDMHRQMQDFVRDLNHLYKTEKALYEVDYSYDGFEWIDCNDNEHSIVSFIRKGKDYHDMLLFICNFTPVVHESYRIGVPFDCYYKEILNSDSEIYGGSNVGNLGGLYARQEDSHGRPFSILMNIPPLSVVVLKPEFENIKPAIKALEEKLS
ncbi:MAG: 1,4-alpha-glucan branching protein GlgB, partial [Clostridiales bacterium]|nr:1,4-alpha-glucan branching protein GlgB [Clostridiales bacterium]